jgi:hypothetical protein
MLSRFGWPIGLVGTLIFLAPVTPSFTADALRPEPLFAMPEMQGKGKPKAQLRINPSTIFVPQRIVATVELTEGANDFQDYYCPKVEWIWDDGTTSESGTDCDPYEAGKSEIRRRYSADHTYRDPGNYQVQFRMKQGTKTVLSLREPVRAQ